MEVFYGEFFLVITFEMNSRKRKPELENIITFASKFISKCLFLKFGGTSVWKSGADEIAGFPYC